MIDLGPFRKALRDQQDTFAKHLLKGFSAQQLAADRKTIEVMEADLARGQSAFGVYFKTDPANPGSPVVRWTTNMQLLALKMLLPSYRDPVAFERQQTRFKAYAAQLRTNVDRAYKFLHDTKKATEVWVVRRNLPTKLVVEQIATAMEAYVDDHPLDPDLLFVWPEDAVWRLLGDDDRPDLGVMLRLATSLPNDIQTYTIRTKDTDDDSLLHLGEFVLSTVFYSIPVIGNALAAFEAWRGKDIWGNELSDFDRAVLGGSVLLPLAGRMIRGGKALYTAERAARLYGEDAREWSKAIAMGEHVSGDAKGLGRLKAASEDLAEAKAVSRAAANDLADTFRTLGLDGSGKALVPSTTRAEVVKLLETVSAKYPRLKDLDAPAIERILAKGGIESHVKGQLFEELMEQQVVKMLRDPFGRVALGIDARVTGNLYYIPGFLIRDEFGLQLTDGIIIRRIKKGLHVVAVFEGKAGDGAARSLGAKFAKPTAKELPELRAEAEESIRELQERARLNQQPPPQVTVEEQMKRIIQTQQGGQIRSDIERLSELKVWINGVEVPVELWSGPKSTRWLGVLPADVGADAIRKAVTDAGIPNFDVLGVDGITSGELQSMAKAIMKAAQAAGIK